MTPLPADKALDAYFLDARAKLLDLAAMLDRLGRGQPGNAAVDPRRQRIERALHILAESPGIDRAAEIQRLFSLEYDPAWKIPEPRY